MPGPAVVDVTSHGARGDVVRQKGSTATRGGVTTVTVPGVHFAPVDVGKLLMVDGAGRPVAPGSPRRLPLYTSIRAADGATAVLADAAGADVSDAWVTWGSDDTAHFQAAAAAVQLAGGGELRVPPATYWVRLEPRNLGTPGPALGHFAALDGVRVAGPGATLLTARDGEAPLGFELFRFDGCSNVEVAGLSVRGHAQEGTTAVEQNAVLVRLFGGCRNVRVSAACTGILTPLMVTAGPYGAGGSSSDYAGDEAFRARGIRLDAVAVNCGYGANFQMSGDDVEAALVTAGCYRSAILYGVRNHRLSIDSRDFVGADVLLQAYPGRTAPGAPATGYGVENVEIAYTNRHTTAGWMSGNGNASVEIDYASAQPAAHRGVRLRYDVRYGAGAAHWGAVLRVNHHGGAGHALERVRVEGRVETPAGSPATPFELNYGGAVAANVAFRDLLFADLSLVGQQTPVLDLAALQGAAEVRRLAYDGAVSALTASGGRVRWVGCRAGSLSTTSASPGSEPVPADYVDCEIGAASARDRAGKTFRNTVAGGVPLEATRTAATVFRDGTPAAWPPAAFRVFHGGAGASYRLRYYVSAGAGAARRELAGSATWTAFMGAAGTPYTFALPPLHDARVLGGGAPAVEVNLAPDGQGAGVVRLGLNGWSGPARATFHLEVLGEGTPAEVRAL
jgi:hypothetical protein